MSENRRFPDNVAAPVLPGADIWAAAARRETGRDMARTAAIAALDPGLHERSPLETLYGVARRNPEQPAIVDAGRVISYRDFWNLIAAFTAKLRAADAPAGPVAMLTADNAVGAGATGASVRGSPPRG